MKQTIILLAFLSALLLLVSGVMAAYNVEAARLLELSEKALKDARSRVTKMEEQLSSSTKENSDTEEKLRQSAQKQEELKTQLAEALVSAQEALDTVRVQAEQNQQLIRYQIALEEENIRLLTECEALAGQLTERNEEAALIAAAHEEQMQADKAYIAQLETQIAAAAAAVGASAPLEPTVSSYEPAATPPSLF